MTWAFNYGKALFVALLLVLPFGAVEPSRAATPVLVPVGGFAGSARAFAIAGDLALLGEGAGLSIIDISEPASMLRRAYLPLPAPAESLAVAGDLAFVAVGVGGLLIVDLRDPAAPWVRGRLTLAQEGDDIRRFALSVAASESLAYLAVGIEAAGYYAGGLLHVIDISDPANPLLLSSAPTSGFPGEIQVADGLAYLATRSTPRILGGLEIFDLADPQALQARGFLPEPSYGGAGVDVVNGFAYVSRVGIVDVRDPGAPRWLAPLADELVRVAGDLAYAVEPSSAMLRVYDLAEPAAPLLVAEQPLSDTQELGLRPISALRVAAGSLFLAQENGLRRFDLGDPRQPVAVARFDSGPIYGVFVDGEQVYADGHFFWRPGAGGSALMAVRDFAGTPNLRVLQVTGGLAYAARSSSLFVVDVAGDLRGTLRAEVPLAAFVQAENANLNDILALQVADGGRAYVLVQWRPTNQRYPLMQQELLILDLADPTAPVLLGRAGYGQLAATGSMALLDGRVYLSDGSSSVAFVDVNDPAAAQFGGRIGGLPAWPQSLRVEGKWLYVGGNGSLALVDLSDPALPTLRGQLGLPGEVETIQIIGDQAVLGLGAGAGLAIVDISNPDTFQLYETVPLPGAVWGLARIGDLLYVACGENGVRVFRLS